MSGPSGNILVVYSLLMHPLRSSVEDHLYAPRRHSARRVFYCNLHAHRKLPRHLLKRRFDAIFFMTSFLSMRWMPELFLEVQRRAEPLRHLDAVKVAVPQDEFLRSAMLCDFISDFGVDAVCSVAPESEWPKIYPTVDREKVRFSRVLTGYLDERTIRRADRIVAEAPQPRPVDIGYRAWEGAPWLGRHGLLKRDVAIESERAAKPLGLSTDISIRSEDTLLGDDWLRFLARCRYVVGVEGGATILDLRGEVKERTERYLADQPEASFDEIEEACFPDEDGRLELFALSPRHLEACATRTVQVLVEGEFNGALEADTHYIPLAPDLGDLDRVLATLADERRRREIAERAYRDVVSSGRFGYPRFVEALEGAAFVGAVEPAVPRDAASRWSLLVNRVYDRLTWTYVAARLRLYPRLRPLILVVLAPLRAVRRVWLRLRPT